ncbi:DUF922 domain-containing protein [Flavobacterium sp. ASW18X]|uniref:DUF922 domain-containing protein n=1 Tax=Flavobacterium sp. ASW18X TaxID=2572595 RepID=UPI001F0F9776|nr:DUF922 domain-containing protein [Flavobacterium sp. ASW18X]
MGFRKGIIVVSLLLGFVLSAQDKEAGVPWQSKQKLSWSDFKGKIPKDAAAAATTASGITYNYSANIWYHEVKVTITITAFFYPNQSWYRPELVNERVLQHEQLHFNITELYARKMKLVVERTAFTENVKEEIQKIYKDTLKEMKDLQERYDWETSFSRNAEAQQRWNKRIAEALERLNDKA